MILQHPKSNTISCLISGYRYYINTFPSYTYETTDKTQLKQTTAGLTH